MRESVRHFFSWAAKHDLISGKNPVDGIEYEGVQKKSYEYFTNEDLTHIFSSDALTKERNRNHPERYWLLLILLYTGARREEIAQLTVGDIKRQDGVWYFDIRGDEERGIRVKNAASQRRVPVHSHLLELGFLEFLKNRKDQGLVLLFPLSRRFKSRKTVGDAVGKW